MNITSLEFKYRLLAQSDIYTDEPQALDLDSRSSEWLRLIDGEFAIYADGDIFYDEEVFPVAEFACGLIKWMRSDKAKGLPYSYDHSMNFEDQEGVLTLTRENDGWRLCAIWEDVPGGIWIPGDELDRKLSAFLNVVRIDVLNKWGVDLTQIEEAVMLA